MSAFETAFKDFFTPDAAAWPFDLQRVHDEWAAIQADTPDGLAPEGASSYDINRWKLPLPIWAKRGYEDQREQAWEILREETLRRGADTPMSIYLHAPFCSSKCGFCDSYSFALSDARAQEKQVYVERLIQELDLWSQTGHLATRPVSTLHLGGGTPTFLGEELFSRLIYACVDRFNTTPATEWALEANTSTLTPAMLDCLHDLGFRRLHIGVQSMEDAVRKGIGRRQPAAAVLETIRAVTERGWVVSVDLVCGLPGQTLRGLLDGILALMAAGVHGFSLYELLIYPQNRKWAEHFHLIERGVERDHRPNYFLFQAGAALLEEHGLRKNLFNHWADEHDQNVYFTFPQRGEDLLAAGTNADGVFGDYHYRHPIYADYLRDSTPHNPGLLGGLRRSARESRLFPYILAVQSGTISAEQTRALTACTYPNGQPLLERWQTHGLLAPLPDGGFRLTSNGSWFAGNLIEELNAVME